jgi:tetratricopeptide (TPR) repeat protein
MMPEQFPFYDEAALLERLSNGLKKYGQQVSFLVGAPMSAPQTPGAPGVPGVDAIVDLIRKEFADDPLQLAEFERFLEIGADKRYQAAFVFLLGRRGQPVANAIVRKAVIAARKPGSAFADTHFDNLAAAEEACRLMDLDASGWNLTPGMKALGQLAAIYREYFGSSILTTNFDPLIQVAIQSSGGHFFRTTLHSDGNLSTEGDGCHIIHLHGFWHGSDTLHTGRQLGQARPQLKASLAALLRNKAVVVCAYSGWDDTFTRALIEVVTDDKAYPEIIWTFHKDLPPAETPLFRHLEPGLNRSRVTLYTNIDCHEFFPKLHSKWMSIQPQTTPPTLLRSNPVAISSELRRQVETVVRSPIILEGDDEDHPPHVAVCVGRDEELRLLGETNAIVVFLTGLGGQGKSTLAAQYFAKSQSSGRFTVYVWRDCKEESERFENQLASVIEKFSSGAITGEDLAKRSIESLTQVLLDLVKDTAVLFVFDNLDHYVDLESFRMTGSPDVFVKSLLLSGSKSKVIFTCRPSVAYAHPQALSVHLEGLTLDATRRLFMERRAPSNSEEIEGAHEITEGHAFWLDLLAVQVARRAPDVQLTSLVSEIRAGRGPLPEKTLTSIWGTLKEHEQVVLRAMAETVKPETEAVIGEYLSPTMNYNRFSRALRQLRALNLIVVKKRPHSEDVLELHPMVRHFVWRNFNHRERLTFINAIIRVYQHYIGRHKSALSERPSLSTLEYWTQNAELDITAGRFADAFMTLSEVADAFAVSAYPREFLRISRLLLSAVDWAKDYEKYKAFEKVFNSQIDQLSYLGEHVEVDQLLDKYERTVVNRDTRYINYCEMRCTSRWVRGDFRLAVEWGTIGRDLKRSSGVDTQFDVELGLPVFLSARKLSEVTDPEELDETRGGAHYGNIGRCLHLMGQIDSALVCYQKSALLIEKDSRREHVLNQGYIRAWIGELLFGRAQYRIAEVFYRAAYSKWERIFPERASKLLVIIQEIRKRNSQFPRIPDVELEKYCRDWILGRNMQHDM